MNRRRIVICGGHVTPALALAAELERRRLWEIIFVGRKIAMEGDKSISFEFRQVCSRGIRFISLSAGRIPRVLTRFTPVSLIKIPIGLVQSFFLLHQLNPCGVLSFGGYVAVPLAISAKILGLPLVTHEQTMAPGLANRFIARLADRVCISWPDTTGYFPKRKTVLTGNPLREEFVSFQTKEVIKNYHQPLLYISGGSLGAEVINKTIVKILPDLLTHFTVVHQCGDSTLTKDYQTLKRYREKLPRKLASRYLLRSHFDAGEVVWFMKHAILVVSRGGANTVTELAFIGRPAILIPLPHAGAREQQANAKLLADRGAAVILWQDKLNADSLFQTIIAMVKKINRYEIKAQQAKKLIIPDAAIRLADIVETTFLSSV